VFVFVILDLIKIGQFGDLLPQAAHDVLVATKTGWATVALALNNASPHGHAFEVLLVQEAVVVNI
jgi:hypothetical protein